MGVMHRLRRLLPVTLIVLSLLAAPLRVWAAPADPATVDPNTVMSAWPVELRALVSGTSEFEKGSWFTDPACKDKRGAPGQYMNSYFKQEKLFRDTLWKQQDPAGYAKFQKVIQDTSADKILDVFPNGNLAFDMDTSVCSADLQRWNGAAQDSVWGFGWAPAPDAGTLQLFERATKALALNGLGEIRLDSDDPDPVATRKLAEQFRTAQGNNGSWPDFADVCGKDLAMFCQRATWADCGNADDESDRNRCAQWNQKVAIHLIGMSNWLESNKDFGDRVGEFFAAIGDGLWTAGKWVLSALGWAVGLVGAVIGWVAKKGMEQVVSFFTESLVDLWGVFAAWVVNFTSPNLTAGSFVNVYNIVAGIMLMMAFLLWLAGFLVAWRRGNFGHSILGGLKAIFAVQHLGIFAFLMVGVAREATQLLIDQFRTSIESTDFAASILLVNPAVGLLMAAAGLVGVIAAFILLVFQVPMVFAHTMFGTVAAAGQAHSATEGWLRAWFFKFLALSWTPFFMVGLMILGQSLLLPTAGDTRQNVGQQLMTVLAGGIMMIALPFTPKMLTSVMSWSTNTALGAAESIGAGAGAKAAHAAAAMAAPAVSAGAQAAGGALRAAASGSVGAVAALGSNMTQWASWDSDGSWGGGAAESGGDQPDGEESGVDSGSAVVDGAAMTKPAAVEPGGQPGAAASDSGESFTTDTQSDNGASSTTDSQSDNGNPTGDSSGAADVAAAVTAAGEGPSSPGDVVPGGGITGAAAGGESGGALAAADHSAGGAPTAKVAQNRSSPATPAGPAAAGGNHPALGQAASANTNIPVGGKPAAGGLVAAPVSSGSGRSKAPGSHPQTTATLGAVSPSEGSVPAGGASSGGGGGGEQTAPGWSSWWPADHEASPPGSPSEMPGAPTMSTSAGRGSPEPDGAGVSSGAADGSSSIRPLPASSIPEVHHVQQ